MIFTKQIHLSSAEFPMNALYLADQTRKDVEVGKHVARMGENSEIHTCLAGET